MLLTPGLAQQVIDSIMPLVQQNVNIMDSAGTIIASCQVKRIGSFHKGAHDVLKHRKTVEITSENLPLFPGSLPGVNMPILIEGQAIGVVGITGQPDEVRGTAKLVKAVTELILERDILLEKIRSQEQLREQFASLLLSEYAAEKMPSITASAKLLKYDMTVSRQVFIINTQPLLQEICGYTSSGPLSAHVQENILQQIRNSPCLTSHDFAVFVEQRLILLKETPPDNASQEPPVFKWDEQLSKILLKKTPLLIGIGSVEPNPSLLHYSYQEALFALNQANPQKSVSSIYDPHVLAAYVLQHAPDIPCRPLNNLREALHKDNIHHFDMTETISALLKNNLNVSLAAKDLFIHRNTLLFRLTRLQNATGLDPCHHFDHAVLCRRLLDL